MIGQGIEGRERANKQNSFDNFRKYNEVLFVLLVINREKMKPEDLEMSGIAKIRFVSYILTTYNFMLHSKFSVSYFCHDYYFERCVHSSCQTYGAYFILFSWLSYLDISESLKGFNFPAHPINHKDVHT